MTLLIIIVDIGDRQRDRQTDRQTAVFLDVFVERLSFIFSRCRYYKKRQ